MATNGQLLRQWSEGKQLLESEIQQLERALDGYDRAATVIGAVSQPNNFFRFNRLSAGSAEFDIPVSRGVTYTDPGGVVIPNSTLTDVTYSATTYRGFVKPADACVQLKSGYTDRFIRNPAVSKNAAIAMYAVIAFATANPNNLYAWFDFYNASGYYGSLGYGHAANEWNLTIYCHELLRDNEEEG